MENLKLVVFIGLLLVSKRLLAQTIKLEASQLEAHQTYMSSEKLMGKRVLKVAKDSTVKAVDEPTYVRIKGLDFQDGVIEVKVLSRLLKTARPSDRGFIGIAFRIDAQNSKFESIYIRPTNGRADDQVRRNHSVQYFSYPNFKFDRLRKEAPETFESYADMGLNEWITMRIEVKGKEAKLFLNNSQYPVLLVKDLKLDDKISGGIGLWVDVGTEGYFRDLKVIKR
ncbi:hypothetical protein [Haliscomenobacter hydrossis]|uniref:3-keto-disaccharide hydrolase domain-containing protein n=1 Tax=Haliscomenobacter hydrossis (strain ATCC 27775 / DSM 1100 / LMG 10767 / O) TaxID=760192 RepID=F4L6M5_HALH1|nr:hypothetical protein [Haliscomenobacter hydrossis]AEE49868.1 hypothetical protein Halhy_1983 [Haliscomenobacter hydrossis DSM 1100]